MMKNCVPLYHERCPSLLQVDTPTCDDRRRGGVSTRPLVGACHTHSTPGGGARSLASVRDTRDVPGGGWARNTHITVCLDDGATRHRDRTHKQTQWWGSPPAPPSHALRQSPPQKDPPPRISITAVTTTVLFDHAGGEGGGGGKLVLGSRTRHFITMARVKHS